MGDVCCAINRFLTLTGNDMMRMLLAITLFVLTLACAQKDPGKGLNKLSGRKTTPESEPSRKQIQVSFDSTFYIGYVDYFPETREFYTPLFYQKGHEYPDEDILESRLDSVIAFEEDWGRERLPMEEAQEMLVLSGLDSIAIYNRRHQLVCRSRLIRVEYLWNGMESNFVAVFQSDGSPVEETHELYGVSAGLSCYETGFQEEELQDARINELLIERMNISRAVKWDMRHYRIDPLQAVFSVVSGYAMDLNKGTSYLTVMEHNDVQILNEEIDNFQFLNILPVPVMVNGRPLMLVSAGYPSSDVIWNYLAWYDGEKYDPVDYNRIHVRNLHRDPVFFADADGNY